MGQVSENGSNVTHLSLAVGSQADPKIMAMVRDGDRAAFDVLFQRHVAAAQFVARAQTDNIGDADDVVSEAFASIFQALTEGKGPDEFFRSYLLTAVRRIAHDRNRKARRTQAVVDGAILDTVAVDADTVLDAFESSTLAKAFKSLPERWQAVLWHVDVEGLKPSAAAAFIGLTPNGVSSLVIRAREGLRQAYLQNHINLSEDDSCLEYSSQLGKYARDGLKRTSREKVEAHLEECPKCTALLMELNDVQAGMRAAVFPLVAGVVFTPAVATGYLPGGSGSSAAGPRSTGGFRRIAVAVLIVCGFAIAGVLMWLGQTGPAPIAEPDAASNAPPVPQSVPEVTPTASATPSPNALPTSDPAATVPQPAAPSLTTPGPAAPPAPAPGSAPAVVPVPQETAPVVDTGPVITTPAPEPSNASAPPSQTVTASFSIQPGTAMPEWQIDVGFSLQGDGTPTTGEAIFSLSPGASFIAGKLMAPAGWTCPDQSAGYIRCTTSSMDPRSLDFGLGTMMSSQAQDATLSYQFSGQRIATTTFTNVFH